MGTMYTNCNNEVLEVLKDISTNNYADIVNAGATFSCLFAEKYDKDTDEPLPSIKVNGVPAIAKISVSSVADRARGMKDIKLTIDRNEWNKLGSESKRAVIDHELYHLVLQDDVDDLGRPKFKLRPHDMEVGVFFNNIQKYSSDSMDLKQVEVLNEQVHRINP